MTNKAKEQLNKTTRVEEIKKEFEKLFVGIPVLTLEELQKQGRLPAEIIERNPNIIFNFFLPYLNLDEDIEKVVLSDFLAWASKNAEPQFRVGEHEARIGWTGTNIVAKAMELFINRKASQPMSNKFIWGNV